MVKGLGYNYANEKITYCLGTLVYDLEIGNNALLPDIIGRMVLEQTSLDELGGPKSPSSRV